MESSYGRASVSEMHEEGWTLRDAGILAACLVAGAAANAEKEAAAGKSKKKESLCLLVWRLLEGC